MAQDTEYNPIDHVLELIIENGFDGLEQAVSILIDEATKVDRSNALSAQPRERTRDRKEGMPTGSRANASNHAWASWI